MRVGEVMDIEALKALRRPHVQCDDPWYSCPATGECTNEAAGEACNCGADPHNKRLDAILAASQQAQERMFTQRELNEAVIHTRWLLEQDLRRIMLDGESVVTCVDRVEAQLADARAKLAAVETESACCVCGKHRAAHCDYDEPGVNHATSCRKWHHTFRDATIAEDTHDTKADDPPGRAR